MRKCIFLCLMLILGFFVVCSCGSYRYPFPTSSGILTYNKLTGNLEILWETQAPSVVVVKDSIRCDSIKGQ